MFDFHETSNAVIYCTWHVLFGRLSCAVLFSYFRIYICLFLIIRCRFVMCLVTFENATENLFNFAVTLMYLTSTSISCRQRSDLVLVYAMADCEWATSDAERDDRETNKHDVALPAGQWTRRSDDAVAVFHDARLLRACSILREQTPVCSWHGPVAARTGLF